MTDVVAMGGIMDRYRRLAPGGQAVATGVAATADAWASTNPSAGRGITMGLMHARALRDVAREHLDDPPALAAALDERTERELAPWYRTTVAEDRARLRMLEASRSGVPPAPPPDAATAARALLPVAAGRDADVFRAYVETRACLATIDEVMARPGLADRVLELTADGAPPLPGPTRAELLELLS
jgi:flavin-dependent dehydrogenase